MSNDDRSPEEFVVAADVLSAIAIVLSEMGEPDEEVRATLYGRWHCMRPKRFRSGSKRRYYLATTIRRDR
ncbi:hypothetical protein EV379_0285 [Microterricola gilva]|uniref:Uncharacterized protein n=1 Tax=Microterricola gilva TaxID=393267 RepID=A0A4V2GAE7_9MICO|nr:hypothetical protein [Microterricola gilva]RZU63996.1 hypothetical protein EV379_0285 [Microterricola gilva]